MSPRSSFARSVSVVCREASRFPWIILSAFEGEVSAHKAEDASGRHEPVLVLGGFLSHPAYYAPLGRILTRRGYGVHFDDVFNAQPFMPHLARLRERVDAIVQASGAPLRIVGHSFGGLQAMALLLECPALVTQVIAVAAPVAGGTPWRPLQRLVEWVSKMRAPDADGLKRRLAPYSRRITTISSPHDLIAPPERCSLEGAANVVLRSVPRTDRTLASHGGVIFMRAAVRVMLRALAGHAQDSRAACAAM